MVADGFTKALNHYKHKAFVRGLNLIDIKDILLGKATASLLE
jgi:hypothetical protein